MWIRYKDRWARNVLYVDAAGEVYSKYTMVVERGLYTRRWGWAVFDRDDECIAHGWGPFAWWGRLAAEWFVWGL